MRGARAEGLRGWQGRSPSPGKKGEGHMLRGSSSGISISDASRMRSDDLDPQSSTPGHYSQLRNSDIPRTGGSSIKDGIFQRTPSSRKPTVAWADSREPDAAQLQSPRSTRSPYSDGPHTWGDDAEGKGEEDGSSDEPEYDSERCGSEDEPPAANGTGAFRVSHRITSNHGEG